jgi:2-phosphosulfolactate phosphatase
MGKIHLLLKKEEIDPQKMEENKVAVIFDVLLATSTITAALHNGASEVIPVLDEKEARAEALHCEEGSYVLVGEYRGKTIDGFLSPNPLALKGKVEGKKVILSTTNGTVALKKSLLAKKVYAASLLNGSAVAEELIKKYYGETIVIVCSGSFDEFNMEDFYGAGYLIDCLLSNDKAAWEMTDATLAAYHFYNGTKNNAKEILKTSRVGRMLASYGFENELQFVSQHGLYDVVPYMDKNHRIVAEWTANRQSI